MDLNLLISMLGTALIGGLLGAALGYWKADKDHKQPIAFSGTCDSCGAETTIQASAVEWAQ